MNQTLIQPASRLIKKSDNFDLGQKFERYIIELFNTEFFHKKKWRISEKFNDSSLLMDYWNPDIEMELFSTGKNKNRFAVECKWRRRFKKGKIRWADEHQIRSYKMFQYQTRISVFVAIGIGGEPDNPEKLFVTPLNNIYMHSELYETDLIPFKRKPTSKFYYDTQLSLLF